MSFTSETHETRQMGAMGIISRSKTEKFSPTAKLFLIQDERKREAAGAPRWVGEKGEHALSFVAGGRQHMEGKMWPENILDTFLRELNEETGIFIRRYKVASEAVQQQYPFIVGQLNPQKGNIDQVAVTSLHIPFDAVPSSARKGIDNLVRKGLGQWVEVRRLLEVFRLAQQDKYSGKDVVSLESYRPQTPVAAWIWWMSENQHYSYEAVEQEVSAVNAVMHSFIQAESKKLNLKVNNGTFNDVGNVLPLHELQRHERRYLFPKSRRKGLPKELENRLAAIAK